MDKEVQSCEDSDTWEVVRRPKGKLVISPKWVYRIKLDHHGQLDQFKSRITPKGYMQQRGVDYFEIFAPTVSYRTKRVLLSLVTRWDYELHQMDVSSAFLHATVKEDVYMEIPEGYEAPMKGDYVLKLKKALYGIHQAPREWYLLIREFIVKTMKLTQCVTDPCMFHKRSATGRLILMIVFVDDCQIGFHREDMEEWYALKAMFMERFKTKDIGESKLMLGMRITRDRRARTMTVDQEVYVTMKLEEFRMADCKAVSTPAVKSADLHVSDGSPQDKDVRQKPYMQLVGALLYAALATRPDVTYAVHQLTMHSQSPKEVHWQAAKRVLRYLSGTKDNALVFGKHGRKSSSASTQGPQDDEMHVTAYADADYANDTSDRRSILGWIVKLNGDVIMWRSKKQDGAAALSTCEAELYAQTECAREVLWLRHLLEELGLHVRPQSVMRCDNQSTNDLAEHGIIREKTKHIDVRHHFITHHIEQDNIKLVYVPSEQQQADILTKPLPRPAFDQHRQSLMAQ